MQTQFLYEYDFAVLFHSLIRQIPVWIRQETQDQALRRTRIKSLLRSVVYRALYLFVNKGFYIGELNRQHFLRHGIAASRLIRAPYCTTDRFKNVTDAQFARIRDACRAKLEVREDRIVIGFFGKLIPKKNPDLLLQAIPFLPEDLKRKGVALFVGSGVLEPEIKAHARRLEQFGIQCVFTGFINQSAIRDYYAATDILVLPSNREGETWGLVVNEGLHAGCSIIMSNAVGCHREFGDWERVRVIAEGDAQGLAAAIADLHRFSPQRRWATDLIAAYSVEAAAQAIAQAITEISPS